MKGSNLSGFLTYALCMFWRPGLDLDLKEIQMSGSKNYGTPMTDREAREHPNRRCNPLGQSGDTTMRDIDLKQHLLRQMAFSHATYGPGCRTEGIADHIRKELVEVLTGGGDPAEWVDLVILALDGLTRSLAYESGERADPVSVAETACHMILSKQARNEARVWPDWRTAAPGKAIEHDRTHDD